MLQQTEHLLQKYRDNQISLPELKELYHLLSVHKDEVAKDVQLHFYAVQEELAWKISAEKSKDILLNIHQRAGIHSSDQKAVRLYPIIIKLSVAAALIGIIVFSAIWLNNKQKVSAKDVAKLDMQPKAALQSLMNTSTANELITLEDSSVVVLTAGAGISYYKPFINLHRDISLTGTAFFKIAKDKTRPFTVYANGIATTALGTQFWVYANTPDSTSVQLIEGKVIIKGTASHGPTMPVVYLTPGQRFYFDRLTNQVAVNNTNAVRQNQLSMPGIAKYSHTGLLVFNKEPLEHVLQKIQQAYNKPFAYHKADVKGLAFTGTFLQSDELPVVLSALCNMNDLTFENTGSGYTISKKK